MSDGDYQIDRRTYFLMGMAAFIGATSTGVAFALVKLIGLASQLFFFGRFRFDMPTIAEHRLGAAVVFIPLLGATLVALLARFGSEKIRGHGIPEALEAILFRKSKIEPKVALLKPISAAISIGSGGPFGAEGPIIMTGGAIGSLIAQTRHLDANERKILLVAGSAAGMTAIFNTPIAAVLLAVELLLFEWKPRAILPVIVATLVAYALRPLCFPEALLFSAPIAYSGGPALLPWLIGVGIAFGAFAIVLSRALYAIEDGFSLLPIHWMWWCVIGGVVVGVGGLLQPRAMGVGYELISGFLNGKIPFAEALPLVAVKAIIWLVALGSGTSGGILAPLLIIGSGAGFVLSHACAAWIPPELAPVLPLVGMAALMTGAMRTPFTAIFFALESTHAFEGILPLFAASGAAFAVSTLFMKRSILTEKISRRGHSLRVEYGLDPLETVRIRDLYGPEEWGPKTSSTAAPSAASATEIRLLSHDTLRAVLKKLGSVQSSQVAIVSAEGGIHREAPEKVLARIVGYFDDEHRRETPLAFMDFKAMDFKA